MKQEGVTGLALLAGGRGPGGRRARSPRERAERRVAELIARVARERPPDLSSLPPHKLLLLLCRLQDGEHDVVSAVSSVLRPSVHHGAPEMRARSDGVVTGAIPEESAPSAGAHANSAAMEVELEALGAAIRDLARMLRELIVVSREQLAALHRLLRAADGEAGA